MNPTAMSFFSGDLGDRIERAADDVVQTVDVQFERQCRASRGSARAGRRRA